MIDYSENRKANPESASFVIFLAGVSGTGPSHIAIALNSSHASNPVRCRASAEMRDRLTMSLADEAPSIHLEEHV